MSKETKEAEQRIVEAVQQGMDEAIGDLGEKTWLLALASAVPWIGPYISSHLSAQGARILRKRIEQLFMSIKELASEIDNNKVDYDYLSSDEFFDLLRQALEETAKTRFNEKIELYAKILCNAATSPNQDHHDPELYLKLISDLSIEEFIALSALYDLQKSGPNQNEDAAEWEERCSWHDLVGHSNWPEDEWRFILRRLQRTGLVSQLTGYVQTMDTEDHFVITPPLNKIMDYLRGVPFD